MELEYAAYIASLPEVDRARAAIEAEAFAAVPSLAELTALSRRDLAAVSAESLDGADALLSGCSPENAR